MPDTLKSLSLAWRDGDLTLEEAARRAASLEYPTRREAPDGHTWMDGPEDDTTPPVHEALGGEHTTVFLLAVAEKLRA